MDRIKVVNGHNSFQVIIEEYFSQFTAFSLKWIHNWCHADHISILRTDRKQPYLDGSWLPSEISIMSTPKNLLFVKHKSTNVKVWHQKYEFISADICPYFVTNKILGFSISFHIDTRITILQCYYNQICWSSFFLLMSA